jgi:Putative glycosyl/glycerophosphate transferases involved in teichoic acid biosynthesis TagF/TagB/EpsJ/RodC
MYKYNRVILHGKHVGEAITELKASSDFYYRPVDSAGDRTKSGDDGKVPETNRGRAAPPTVRRIGKHMVAFLMAARQLEVVGYNFGEQELNLHQQNVVSPQIKQKRRDIIRQKIQGHVPVNVLFLTTRISTWSWDGLYQLFAADDRFIPTVCVIPWTHDGDNEMIRYMNQTYLLLKNKGYNIIQTFDADTKEYFDLRQLQPDIMFHELPWFNHVNPNYFIANFDETLNYLIEYGASGALNPDGHCNLDGHHLADTVFLPSRTELKLYRTFSDNDGKNGVFLGYPKLDPFFDKFYYPKDVWKKQETSKKKVIWAPHFFFFSDNLYRTSTFVQLYDVMLKIAKKYQDKVQFAFKPHPMLKNALCFQRFGDGDPWGWEKTEQYYTQWWSRLPNCQLDDGEFTDLFLTSDAMIFDSISFMSEYACAGKPALFTIATTSRLGFDDFGFQAFETLYKCGAVEEEIEKFIEEVVLSGKDPMKKKRESFVRKNMRPPYQRLASENIYRYAIQDMTQGLL